jgi:hypothetical protein
VTAASQNRSGFTPRKTGLLLLVSILVLVLAFEPGLSWFVIPALLVGIIAALFLRSSNRAVPLSSNENRPEIQIAKIPVKGAMGLVFTLGTIVIFIALPEARWFLVLAIPTGVVVAIALHAWRGGGI